MSWEALVSHVLATSSKVDKMAVFDGTGRPVALTEDMESCQSEGLALVNCLNDPARTLTKLHLDNDVFLCVQGIDPTLVGTSVRNPSRVVVARRAGDHAVVVLGNTQGKGSFIFELKQALTLQAEGKLVGQQLHPQQLVTTDGHNNDSQSGAVGTEQVLVDLA